MQIGVVGLGLIGGSVLRAIAHSGMQVVGFDTDGATRREAAAAGYPMADNLSQMSNMDMVVLAVPLPALPEVLPSFANFTGVLTDVTSVKAPVAQAVRQHCPKTRFVGGHPMSGKEISGFAASDAGLFDERPWVLCLDDDTTLDDWFSCARFAIGLGARVVATTPSDHDAAVARISHVPHLLASSLARAASDPLAASLAAGSFADGTRVAASSPALIAAMCSGNIAPVLEELDERITALNDAKQALASSQPLEALTNWLLPGYQVRHDWPPAASVTKTIDATRENLLELGRQGAWVEAVQPGHCQIIVKYVEPEIP